MITTFYSIVFGFLLINIRYVKLTPVLNSSKVITEKLETIFLNGEHNAVISPYSVYSALNPLRFGAEGDTKLELESALCDFQFQYNENSKNTENIASTTAVFSSTSIKLLPEFKKSLLEAHVESKEDFDFKNYEAINEFVKNATNGLIQDLVGPNTFRKDTELVIINGVHFDAPWKSPFQPTYRNIPFTYSDGTVQDIPMMYQKNSNYIARVKDLDATILELPYKSLTKVFRIYLPSKHDGLTGLLKKLQSFNTSKIAFKLSEIEVTIPRFRIETEIKVTKGLDKLGLKSLTQPNANLSRIAQKPLRVDEIISKSVIDVSEDGTKAGSATGIFVVPLSGFIADEFVANRPFYFEIRDTNSNSSSVYFSGVFTTPDAPAPTSSDFPNFASRLNPPAQKTDSPPLKSESPPPVVQGEDPWWFHTGKPEYLNLPTEIVNSTPRFQQPEPIYPSGIRFPYPLKDPNTQLVIDTHLRNASLNAVI